MGDHDLVFMMAHAPAEPQSWFAPTMATRRPTAPLVDNIADPETRADVREAINADADPRTPEGMAWLEMRNAIFDEIKAWDEEREKQRCIQWPAAWAREVLAAASMYVPARWLRGE